MFRVWEARILAQGMSPPEKLTWPLSPAYTRETLEKGLPSALNGGALTWTDGAPELSQLPQPIHSGHHSPGALGNWDVAGSNNTNVLNGT